MLMLAARLSVFLFTQKVDIIHIHSLEVSAEWRSKSTALTGLELEWQPITIEMLAWI
jgi:hypothetical protein